jgi:hypothetical protein
MKRLGQFLGILFVGFAVCVRIDGQTNSTATSTQTVETIVSIRHAEKPPGGLGQLTCRGLNRALALPAVLLAKYSSPQFVFAPNPSQKVDGKDHDEYFYVRPLATIEPTAIRCGLPVDTQFGFKEIQGLRKRRHFYRVGTRAARRVRKRSGQIPWRRPETGPSLATR